MTVHIPEWWAYVTAFVAGVAVGGFHRWLDRETRN